MTKLDKEQKAGQPTKKYLWLGYGNYGGSPNPQIGSGFIRNPGLIEKLRSVQKNGLK